MLTLYLVAVSIPQTKTVRPSANAMHRLRWMKMMLFFLFFASFFLYQNENESQRAVYNAYLNITYVSMTMERPRHTRDIPHPMYETIDNASSAAVGCGQQQNLFIVVYIYLLTFVPRTLTSTAKLVR